MGLGELFDFVCVGGVPLPYSIRIYQDTSHAHKNQITPPGPFTSSHTPTTPPDKLAAQDASLLAARPRMRTAGPPRGGFGPCALPQCHPAA